MCAFASLHQVLRERHPSPASWINASKGRRKLMPLYFFNLCHAIHFNTYSQYASKHHKSYIWLGVVSSKRTPGLRGRYGQPIYPDERDDRTAVCSVLNLSDPGYPSLLRFSVCFSLAGRRVQRRCSRITLAERSGGSLRKQRTVRLPRFPREPAPRLAAWTGGHGPPKTIPRE